MLDKKHFISIIGFFVIVTIFQGFAIAQSRTLRFTDLPDPESYPKSIEQNDLGQNISNGMPTKIRLFKTRDPVDLVISYFENQWKIKGYQVTQSEVGGGMRNISALIGPRWDIMKTIVLYQEVGSKLTVAFSSTTQVDLNKMDETASNPSDIPIAPNTEVVYNYEAQEGNLANMVVHHSKSPMDQNIAYYRAQMLSRGWTLETDASSGGPQTGTPIMLFKKGGKRTCTISFSNKINEEGTLIAIQYMK